MVAMMFRFIDFFSVFVSLIIITLPFNGVTEIFSFIYRFCMVNLYDEITFPHPQLTKYNNVSHNTQECNSIWHRPRIWYLASMWNRLFRKFCTEEIWIGMQVIFPNVLNPILDVDLFRKDLFIFKINLIHFYFIQKREL